MAVERKFPLELLEASDQERMEYFVTQVMVDHPMLDQTLSILEDRVNPLLEKRLVLLLGGAGVGKTALLKKIVDRRAASKANHIKENPQIVPSIYYEVEAPDKGKFAFSALYRGALVSMNSAQIDRTLPLVERKVREQAVQTLYIEHAERKASTYALKHRFILNLVDRQVELLCLDEAINCFKVGKVRTEDERKIQLKEQADKLKTFANKTPTTIVLAGSYDFYDLTLVSGQIARRSAIVHMEPYDNSPAGLKGFATALIGLLSKLPIEHDLDPGSCAVEFYLQSLGCIGNLKNILSDALLKALQRKVRLTKSLVRECFFTASQLEVMRAEMSQGVERVRKLMSIEELVKNMPVSESASDSSPAMTGKKLAPGETTPSRRSIATKNWNEQ